MLYKLLVEVEVMATLGYTILAVGAILKVKQITHRGLCEVSFMYTDTEELKEGAKFSMQASVLLLGGERING